MVFLLKFKMSIRKPKSDIRNFFQPSSKKLRITDEHSLDEQTHFVDSQDLPGSASLVQIDKNENINDEIGGCDESLQPTSCSPLEQTYDIGFYIRTGLNAGFLDDTKKEAVFRNTWVPSLTYKFPVQQCQSFTRHFQRAWLINYPWLAYSDVKKGLFCKTCVLFLTNLERGKGSHQQINQFIRSVFTNWKKATENFAHHAQLNYHKDACAAAESFLSVFDSKLYDIRLQISTNAQKEAEENIKKLLKIIKNIKFCGRQELSLRGHVDSGRVTLEDPPFNDGNFRALLRFRIQSGDEILKKRLLHSGNNAMYTSPDIQNEFIELIGDEITSQIIKHANKSRFFTVLADETTDISRVEQFSLCIRYVDLDLYLVREDFLKFVPVVDVTGNGLVTVLKNQLQKLGLDMHNLRDQGYDGAAAMKGAFNGVQAIIQNEFPKAIHIYPLYFTLSQFMS